MKMRRFWRQNESENCSRLLPRFSISLFSLSRFSIKFFMEQKFLFMLFHLSVACNFHFCCFLQNCFSRLSSCFLSSLVQMCLCSLKCDINYFSTSAALVWVRLRFNMSKSLFFFSSALRYDFILDIVCVCVIAIVLILRQRLWGRGSW